MDSLMALIKWDDGKKKDWRLFVIIFFANLSEITSQNWKNTEIGSKNCCKQQFLPLTRFDASAISVVIFFTQNIP